MNNPKKDPVSTSALAKYEEVKKKVKATLEQNPKLFDYIKSRIPLYSEYEDKVWKDIISNLMLLYSWRIPPSMASNNALLALFETHFIQNVTTFYEFVLGSRVNPDPRLATKGMSVQDKVKKDRKPSFLDTWDGTPEDKIN